VATLEQMTGLAERMAAALEGDELLGARFNLKLRCWGTAGPDAGDVLEEAAVFVLDLRSGREWELLADADWERLRPELLRLAQLPAPAPGPWPARARWGNRAARRAHRGSL
jgi:hypothetical protein